jgi:transposase-like protein
MALRRLTAPQLKALKEAVGGQDKLEAFKALAWQRHVADAACPHCAGATFWRWGTTASGQARLRCRSCLKTFTPLSGTGFERLHGKARLFVNAECMAVGMSVKDTAERLQVNKKTAYRWRRRFMPLLDKHQPAMLAGMLEADETFFRKSYKGQRSGLPRKSYKRGTPAEKRGINDEHVAVLTAMERGSRECLIAILPAVPNANSVTAALEGYIAPGSVLCTDGSNAYIKVEPMLEVEVHSVSAAAHVDGEVHVQNVNALHSRIKDWIHGFKGVATKNLGLYLAWFRFFDRDSSRKAWSGFLLDSFGVPYFNT